MCSIFETQMKKIFPVLRKVAIVLSALVLFILGTGLVVLTVYEDEVVGYAIDQFNEQLETKASVGSVDLVFWETFPKASLKFTQVFIPETFPEKDTLIFAEELYLAFDLSDIIKGKYDINEIKTKNSKAYLKINKKGEDNWHFLKKTGEDTSKVTMNLEEVKMKDFHFIFENRKDLFFVDTRSEELNLEGNFSSENMTVSFETNTWVKTLISGDEEYLDNRQIQAQTKLDISTTDHRYVIHPSEMTIDNVPFLLQCNYVSGEKSIIDLSVVGNDIQLTDLFQVLPASYKDKAMSYDAEGMVTFELFVKGNTDKGKSPDISASFTIVDGEIEHKDSGIKASGIECNAQYVKGAKQDQLRINSLRTVLQGGIVQANGFIYSLNDPQVDLNIDADVQLGDLKKFFSWDTLEVCEGQMILKSHLTGPIRSSQKEGLKSEGNAILKDARAKLKGSNRMFEMVNAKVAFTDRNASVEELKGVVNGSDFYISGKLINLIPFLLNDSERLEATANFSSTNLDFTSLVESSEGSAESKDYNFELPKRIDFKLNSSINKFTFGQFEAGAIHASMNYQNGIMDIRPLSFRTSDGEVSAEIQLARTNEQNYFLRSGVELKNLNIKKVFASLNNLGQTFITDANLQGTTNAIVQLEVPLSDKLKMDLAKLHSLIDIEIKNGQLAGLQSLQEIASYIKKNKWLAPFVDEDKFAESMKDIRFATLENVIEIKDSKVFIPQMDIRSSALDISASGQHSFDNSINYTIGFRLRDILVRKNKDHFEEDDGLGKQMFIYMRGTTSNPEFGIDKEASRQDRQDEIIAEKQSIKALLKQELGLFKNDPTIGGYKEVEKAPSAVTTVEWGENDIKEGSDTPKTNESNRLKDETPSGGENTKTNKKGKKLPKWLQEKE